MKEELDREILRQTLDSEYIGIHIENIKYPEINPFDLFKKPGGELVIAVCYFSVPESSLLETDENEEMNQLIKTSDGLIRIAKGRINYLMATACLNNGMGEEAQKILDGDSGYIKYYAKVRTGEVWTKELAGKRLQEMLNDMKKSIGFKEV